MNSTESALEFLKNTVTSNQAPEDSEPETVELKIHRQAFKNWMKDEEAKYLCKFIDRTTSADNRRSKNAEYFENGSTEEPEAKRMRMMEQKGKPKALFSAVSI